MTITIIVARQAISNVLYIPNWFYSCRIKKIVINHDNLEEFQDPRNYDLEESANTKPAAIFYGDLAEKTGGPVLEVACGTGLVTIPIASRGFEVMGVDICRPMLSHAKAKSKQAGLDIDWRESDARQLSLGKRFNLVYITGNAFQAFLSREDQNDFLASVRSHLTDNGTFGFDTRNPSGHNLTTIRDEEIWMEYKNFDGHQVRISGTQEYDDDNQIMHWTTYRRWSEGELPKEKTSRIACRFTWPAELSSLLRQHGFQIKAQYGNWDMEPIRYDSKVLLTICSISH